MNPQSQSPSHFVRYRVNDNTLPDSERTSTIDVLASPTDIDFLVTQGYLLLRDVVPHDLILRFRAALDRIVAEEAHTPASEVLEGNGHYLRGLMDKDSVFVELLRAKKPLSIARAVLGPRVWFDVEARVVAARMGGQKVNWHIHHRVILSPMPAFFAYPHALHGLLYLDDVDAAAGPICLLPGSHRQRDIDFSADDCEHKQGELVVPVRAGECLLVHANLWHRTVPTTEETGVRRLLLFGYTPSWIRGDVARGVRVHSPHVETLRKSDERETRELLGEFFW